MELYAAVSKNSYNFINRPSRARTYDLRIRNPLLYPAEL